MLISIIIPIYNVSNYIGSCLESVYNQTYSSLDIILINDCSTDNSMSIAEPFIDKLKVKFSTIVVNHDSNQGLSAARNTGVKQAKGEYIFFLDSDDELLPNSMSLLVNSVIENNLPDFCIGNFKVLGSNIDFSLRIKDTLISNTDIFNSYVDGLWCVMACNKLINRYFFIENKLWFEKGLLHEDEKFAFQLAVNATSLSTVIDDTYLYKVRHQNSITSNKSYKNYLDMLSINNYKINYIVGNLVDRSDLHLSSLIINSVYNYLLSVESSSVLTNYEKRTLYAEQLVVYAKIPSCMINVNNCRLLVKKYILLLYPSLLRYLLRFL